MSSSTGAYCFYRVFVSSFVVVKRRRELLPRRTSCSLLYVPPNVACPVATACPAVPAISQYQYACAAKSWVFSLLELGGAIVRPEGARKPGDRRADHHCRVVLHVFHVLDVFLNIQWLRAAAGIASRALIGLGEDAAEGLLSARTYVARPAFLARAITRDLPSS